MVSIDEALKDLNTLVGLKSVKDAVTKITNSLYRPKNLPAKRKRLPSTLFLWVTPAREKRLSQE